MTMRVTMRDPRRSEDGFSTLLVGQTYTVSDDYGKELVQRGHASDTDGVIPTEAAANRDDLLASEVRLARGLVSGAVNSAQALAGTSLGDVAGSVRTLSDGANAGARLRWYQPATLSVHTWCWDIYPQTQYQG